MSRPTRRGSRRLRPVALPSAALVLVGLAACGGPSQLGIGDESDFAVPTDAARLRDLAPEYDLATPDLAAPPDLAMRPRDCNPGDKQSMPCGQCGMAVRTCNMDGAWGAWGGCDGQGPCAPGATRPGGCDQCSQEVCEGNCQWGGCRLRPGNACEYKAGKNTRGCNCKNGCGGSALQWCLNNCQWSTQCACCTSSCVNC